MKWIIIVPFVLYAVNCAKWAEFKQHYEIFLSKIDRVGRQYAYNGKVINLKQIFPKIPNQIEVPITCGGNDNNYCNYPDIIPVESVEMSQLMEFPIKSGPCPVDYDKMETYDCLNFAPALFETTCCIYNNVNQQMSDPAMRATSLCDKSTRITASVQGCDGSIYLFSANRVWEINSNFDLTNESPIQLMSFSMGAMINPDSWVEAAVLREDCTIDLFTSEVVGGNQKFVNIDLAKLSPMATGEVGVSAPYDNLVGRYVQAGLSLTKAGVSVSHVNILISGVDQFTEDGQQYDAMIGNWLINGAHTASVDHVNLEWAQDENGKPIPITAAFYEPNKDLIYVIDDKDVQQLWTFRRDGKKMAGTPQNLNSVLNICNPGGRATDPAHEDDEKIVVYVPMPVPQSPYAGGYPQQPPQ